MQLDVERELPDIWADQHRLLQVLENLIGNAIKFTPAGGRITVGASPGEREVLFRVSDTGCGISPTDLPHVFDRFWQARKGREGAGLGLPIASGIIAGHGGQIWVKSTLGHGTTFSFTIPRADAVPGRGARHRTTEPGMRRAAA
jgi:signal transduction histidine kinase